MTAATLGGPGSVSGTPNRPPRLTARFTSRCIDGAQVRLHGVVGGQGPLLLAARIAALS
jgi:hypothetical protein